MNLVCKQSLRICASLLLAIFVGAGAATAADVTAPMPTKAAALLPSAIASPWSFTATPYAWLTSIHGSSTVANHTTDIDKSFIDLVRNAEIPKNLFAMTGFFEARNDRFSIFTDLSYQKIGVSASGSKSFDIGAIKGTPLATAALSASVGANFQMAIAQVGAAYEIARWGSSASMPGSSTAVDVYGGARLWWQRLEVDADLSATITGNLGILNLTASGNRAIAKSGDVTWVDPVVGARLRQQFMPGQELTLSGDVGGFGAGSKFSWQTVAAYNFDIAKTNNVTWAGMVGYKALYVDYAQGSGITKYEYNILEYGPILGLRARF
jgi:hypothetical protein